jgi:hypothetical protein
MDRRAEPKQQKPQRITRRSHPMRWIVKRRPPRTSSSTLRWAADFL